MFFCWNFRYAWRTVNDFLEEDDMDIEDFIEDMIPAVLGLVGCVCPPPFSMRTTHNVHGVGLCVIPLYWLCAAHLLAELVGCANIGAGCWCTAVSGQYRLCISRWRVPFVTNPSPSLSQFLVIVEVRTRFHAQVADQNTLWCAASLTSAPCWTDNERHVQASRIWNVW